MKWQFCLIVTWFVLITANRTDEGYPRGFLPICADSEKPTRISKRKLASLQFVVEGITRNVYSYFEAVQGIANDPNLDFRKRDTVVFVSGWFDSTRTPFCMGISGAYRRRGKHNVIMLDTATFTTAPFPVAARLSREVGRHTAKVLAGLVHHGLDPHRLHLVGLSLGGHTIGFIGKHFRNITGTNIGRITALDPAGPCFRTLSEEHRLSPTDADRVDVLHSNIDEYGMATRMGHVDFYINGGEYQPSNIAIIPCTGMCAHLKSYILWLLSLDYPDKYLAVKCDSIQEARDANCFKHRPLVTNLMGPDTDFSKPGIYYLATDNLYPYYLGRKGLKEEMEIFKRLTRRHSGDINIYV